MEGKKNISNTKVDGIKPRIRATTDFGKYFDIVRGGGYRP